jgi:phosphatidylcholine synthase
MWRKLLAWAVHLYTASGLVIAAWMAVGIVRGDAAGFRQVMIGMVLATVIDGTDGMLARKAQVKKVLPQFSGRRLDDLIDFHTYTTLPLLMIWRAQLLPAGTEAWLLLPLLASAYGFSQEEAKTADGYFLGFPSYWNVLAFYLYNLRLSPHVALGVVVLCAVLTFVPSKYLYPSIGGPYSREMMVGCCGWAALILYVLLAQPASSVALLWVSFAFPLWYFVLSWKVTLADWMGSGR